MSYSDRQTSLRSSSLQITALAQRPKFLALDQSPSLWPWPCHPHLGLAVSGLGLVPCGLVNITTTYHHTLLITIVTIWVIVTVTAKLTGSKSSIALINIYCVYSSAEIATKHKHNTQLWLQPVIACNKLVFDQAQSNSLQSLPCVMFIFAIQAELKSQDTL